MPERTVRLQLPLKLVEKIVARERLTEGEITYLKARLLAHQAYEMMHAEPARRTEKGHKK